jgi:hypothetical protein
MGKFLRRNQRDIVHLSLWNGAVRAMTIEQSTMNNESASNFLPDCLRNPAGRKPADNSILVMRQKVRFIKSASGGLVDSLCPSFIPASQDKD